MSIASSGNQSNGKLFVRFLYSEEYECYSREKTSMEELLGSIIFSPYLQDTEREEFRNWGGGGGVYL